MRSRTPETLGKRLVLPEDLDPAADRAPVPEQADVAALESTIERLAGRVEQAEADATAAWDRARKDRMAQVTVCRRLEAVLRALVDAYDPPGEIDDEALAAAVKNGRDLLASAPWMDMET